MKQASHLVDVEARVFGLVPVTSKELMHLRVINEAVVVFVVVAMVSAGITLSSLLGTKKR